MIKLESKSTFNFLSLCYIILFAIAITSFVSCDDDTQIEDPVIIDEEDDDDVIQEFEILVQSPNLPNNPYNYADVDLPPYFNDAQINNQDNTPNNNPITDHGATLGRVLFYDVNLSANNTISCASCHRQNEGFSNNVPFSLGFEGGLTGRNSMGITNAKFYENGHFFWDERAETLEEQVLMPIQDAVEMGLNLATLAEKVDAIDYYQALFINAFGDSNVTSDRISSALAQYVRSIVSYQTKFDEGLQLIGANNNIGATPFPNFTDSENLGKGLFFSGRTNCSQCHGTINFVGDEPRNNGLDIVYEDDGVGALSGNPEDAGEFKIGSLRNIALTEPYMHDGRFQTLEEVVQFYNNGIQPHPNLDQRLRQGGGGPGGPNGVQPRRMNLNPQERAALVDFLETLTDPVITTDIRFSNPFN